MLSGPKRGLILSTRPSGPLPGKTFARDYTVPRRRPYGAWRASDRYRGGQTVDGGSLAAAVSTPRWRGLVEADLDFLADYAHRISLQIFGRRWIEHLSGADVEPRGMQRALDRLAIEPAIG